uniref:Uncharacterized protein n=1 Tax=Romanomermis culicivorax TaxID=13658 RepID=A0A915I6I4_ROMCU
MNNTKRKLGEFDENESLALRAWLQEAKFRQMLKRQRLKERTILQKLNEKEDDLYLFRSSSSNDDDSSSNDERDHFSTSSKVADAKTKIFSHGKNKDENFGSTEVVMYLKFLACDRLISKFLKVDYCKKIADNYLLATVFVYFKRYLAIEMEEDEEEVKYDILPWALGNDWRTSFTEFIAEKDELWKKMNFSSMVSWECIQKNGKDRYRGKTSGLFTFDLDSTALMPQFYLRN